MEEKKVPYTAQNTYATLNQPGPETTHTWWVFHGMGYLSRYFLKYFKELPPEHHYIIAPQAPSKYYLTDAYKHVGASWLTREDTAAEFKNVLSYIDAVYKDVTLPGNTRTVVLGFSQGVSVALRWLVQRKVAADEIILYAGGIPDEITPADTEFLFPRASVSVVYGKEDPYLTPQRIQKEEVKIKRLFGDHSQKIEFPGGHEIRPEILREILKN